MVEPSFLNDILFKIVFGTQQHERLLRALLNATLGFTGQDRIAETTILNPHVDKAHLAERGVILDVKARDQRGRLYNVEVQVTDEPEYIHRALYYLARLYAEQLHKGDPYERLNRCIALSLLDYTVFPDLEDLHSVYRFHDAVHERELTDILEIHFIELSKLQPSGALQTPLAQWLHLLKFSNLYQDLDGLPESLRHEEEIVMAFDALQQACSNEEVRELIAFREKALHDEATRIARAHRAGREEGREEGREKGLHEKALEMARRLQTKGFSQQEIIELTGLKAEDLPH